MEPQRGKGFMDIDWQIMNAWQEQLRHHYAAGSSWISIGRIMNAWQEQLRHQYRGAVIIL